MLARSSSRLGDLAHYQNGYPFKPADWGSDGTPIIRIQNLTQNSSSFNRTLKDVPAKFHVEPGDLLYSWSATLGAFIWRGEPGYLNQHIFKVSPVEGVDRDFLFYTLKHVTDALTAKTHGSTMRHVTKSDFDAVPVNLPSFDEQRRLVDLLDRAAGLKRLAEQARAKAGKLIPALFIDMFGDPSTNPMGWPKAKLSELGTLDRGRSRHRPRNDPALFGGEHPFIQTGDVAAARGLIRTVKQYYSDTGLAQSRMWPAGTLCITIAANIAQTGVLTFPACFPDSVVGFTPAESVCTRYVQHFIDHLRPYLEQTAPQLAQKNINLEILRNVHIPVPPSELQNQFEEHLARTEGLEELAYNATTTAERISAALMSRLFAN